MILNNILLPFLCVLNPTREDLAKIILEQESVQAIERAIGSYRAACAEDHEADCPCMHSCSTVDMSDLLDQLEDLDDGDVELFYYILDCPEYRKLDGARARFLDRYFSEYVLPGVF